MSNRHEIMWCLVCGARFTQDEISGWGCPKCKSGDVPCSCEQDITVEVNWLEIRILTIWAENWANQCDDAESSTLVVHAIARRLRGQYPELGHLTLSGEIAALPADLAASGIDVGPIETNIPKPALIPVNGPGSVGHARTA